MCVGIVNCNKLLVGVSSLVFFGGIGVSGNFNFGVYYVVDYCVYLVVLLIVEEL